jgi:inward rectifier potassium channel
MAKQKEEFRDLGFGNKAVERNQRLINPDGSFNVEIKGQPLGERYHLYHNLISMSWARFSMIVLIYYLLSNVFFAVIYMAIGTEHLAGVIGSSPSDRFMEAFFFSAQTVTTVGYGRISPVGLTTSLVAAVESMLGLLGFALATGLLYGRFSKPEARILYSRNAVIAPYREMKGFMLRVANKRRSKLIELEAQLLLSMNEISEGKTTRQFYNLNLERSKINLIPTSWTIVHPIDENSPMKDITIEQLQKADAEFLVMLKAFDETFSQTVYSRFSYQVNEVVPDARFSNIIVTNEEGKTTMLYDKFHEISPVN